MNEFTVNTIGYIRSEIKNPEDAPRQGDEGAPAVWIDLKEDMLDGLRDIKEGDELIILTWLHLGKRDVLLVHPRGDKDIPHTGVFSTRSPHRPNPIGLHEVTVIEVRPGKLKIAPMEAVDGTPVIDIKPVLGPIEER